MNLNKYKRWAAATLLALASASAGASNFIYRIPVPGLQSSAISSPPTGDPYFQDVELLLHLDGNYNDVKGHTLTPVGYPAFGTGKFGQAVNFATQMTYLSMPSSSDFNFGTGDFTVEAWVYPNSGTSNGFDYSIYYQGEVAASNTQLFSFEVVGNASGTGTLRFVARDASSTVADVSGGTVPYNTWSHVALVRSGSNLNLYLNGALTATGNIGAVAIPFPSAYSISIGARSNSGSVTAGSFPGWMDEIRVTKGYARYTGSSYIVPSAAFLSN